MIMVCNQSSDQLNLTLITFTSGFNKGSFRAESDNSFLSIDLALTTMKAFLTCFLLYFLLNYNFSLICVRFKNVFVLMNLKNFWFKAKFDVHVRGIRCTNFDPEYVKLRRCEVKAVRGHKGIIYGLVDMLKPLDFPLVRVMSL